MNCDAFIYVFFFKLTYIMIPLYLKKNRRTLNEYFIYEFIIEYEKRNLLYHHILI